MRLINFSDGFSSSTEPILGLLTATSLKSFAADADFVTDKGEIAAVGDIYLRSSDNKIRFYNGTSWATVASQDASGNLVIEGNLTVQGTTTTINSQTLDVVDKNITTNKGGNDTTAEGAGLTVDRSSADGSLVYDSTLTSKWKAGNAGFESEIATVSGPQTLTEKTIIAGGDFNPNGHAISDASNNILISPKDKLLRAKESSKTQYVEEEYFSSVALLSAQTNTVITELSFDTAVYCGVEITYVVKDTNGSTKIGTFRAVYSNSDAFSNSTYAGSGDVVLSCDLSAGTLRILYSSGAYAATLKADVKRFLI